MSLKAGDGGDPSLISYNGVIKINVNNMNDNDPVISPATFAVTVAEDSPAGTTVQQFFATDADTAIDVFSLNVASSFFQVCV